MRLKLVTAIAFALAAASPSWAATAPVRPNQAAPAADAVTTQLPRGVRPSHYALTITPHLAAMAFDGQAQIHIQVAHTVNQLTFNAAELSFSQASLQQADGQPVASALPVEVDAGKQTATVRLSQPLPAGDYLLNLAYRGKINTQPNGLFVINYVSTHGQRQALYTQFENSDARRFMPAWDEPAFKASYDLTVIVPSADMAVSNMPIAARQSLAKGLSRVRFATTPKMSSYLLFFGLGDFQRATAQSDGTEIGVITQRGKVDQAQFALTSAQSILHEYNQYFGIKYPLLKLDNIASPGSSQFFGAMENWGAIFTFEYYLLLDPEFSTQGDKEAVFSTAAHEMAHQWFGDLVTMRWWDDLWLNEGFASWMENRTMARLHPEWHTQLQAVAVREGAMSRDAIASTHPIIQPIASVEQAGEAFDTITYSKGEAVIRMLENYVGPQAWREGVHRYLLAHAEGNAVSDDLWRAVESTAAGKPVTAVAHDFTLQPGIPLVELVAQSCHAGQTRLQLKQGEFTRDRPNKAPLHWDVPVTVQRLGGQPQQILLEHGQAELELAGCGPVLINAGETGYYRSAYNPAAFAAIEAHFAAVPAIDQLGLLGDSWALGVAGRAPISQYLALVDATPAQADPQVWDAIADGLSFLDDAYQTQPVARAQLRRYAIAKLKPQFERLGWTVKPAESAPDTLLRTQLIRVLGAMGEPTILAEARRRYAAEHTDPQALPAALRKTVLAVLASQADSSLWADMHARAQAETTPLMRDIWYRLLASSENPQLAQQALQLALSSEPGATNSAGMVSAVSRQHPELAYAFALQHKSQLDRMIDGSAATAFYPRLAASSSQPAMIGQLQQFAAKYMATGSRRSVDSAIEHIQNSIEFQQQRLPAVTQWLQQHPGH